MRHAIAYIDTSALLRVILREPDALDDLRTYDGLVSSELIAVESARTIDRLRMQGALSMEEAAERTGAVNEWLEAIDLVLLRPAVLSRASEPMPMPIGTSDAFTCQARCSGVIAWAHCRRWRRTTRRLERPRAPSASTFGAREPDEPRSGESRG